MPEMGDLLEGYLYRKRELEEEEMAQEEKKRQKLQDQLAELNLKSLQREMDRSAYEYEQKKKWYEGLGQLDPDEIKEALYGIEPEKPGKPPYPWMGTPYEELGARKEFYIAPEKEKSSTFLSESQRRAIIAGKFQSGEYTPQTHPVLWEYLRKPPTQDAFSYFIQTGQWPAEMGGPSPTIPELTPPAEEPIGAEPPETQPPLMMGGREVPREIPFAPETPSIFSPEFAEQKRRETLAETLREFELTRIPIDFEKTDIALQRLKKIPKEEALRDLEENRIQHRRAGLDVDYLIRRIKGK